MLNAHIHQIYYSDESRALIDDGFQGLDNMTNERPDWREYWPIRKFLLEQPIVAKDYYGFFSPKFKSKTGLDSATVFDFVQRQAHCADVILFSPHFDQSAYFLNIFKQGSTQHKELTATFRDCASIVAPEVDYVTLTMDSRTTVFCNYFVAKAEFWMDWLTRCERIFKIAESAENDLSKRLNADIIYDNNLVCPGKVFVIERIASLMLSIPNKWTSKAYDPISLTWSGARIPRYRQQMVILDALKIAHSETGSTHYLDVFSQLTTKGTDQPRGM